MITDPKIREALQSIEAAQNLLFKAVRLLEGREPKLWPLQHKASALAKAVHDHWHKLNTAAENLEASKLINVLDGEAANAR